MFSSYFFKSVALSALFIFSVQSHPSSFNHNAGAPFRQANLY